MFEKLTNLESPLRSCKAALFFVVTFLLFPALYAVPPVVFDFENPADDSRWQLNSGNAVVVGQLPNRWCFTTADYFTGSRSLVLSNRFADSAPATTYSNTGTDVSVAAYTVITLPKGTYDLSFAWRCMGEGSSDGFYVLWVPQGIDVSSSALGISNDLLARAEVFPDRHGTASQNPIFNGQSLWQVDTKTIRSDGNPYKLAFVWVNNGSVVRPPSACIDFIQIAEHKDCTMPSEIDIVSTIYADRGSVTWKGVAEEYEVMYRRYVDPSENAAPETASYVDGIADAHSVDVSLGEQGIYDFWVRGICGGDTSIWVPYRNKLIYFPGCIDYANLDKASCSHNVRPDEIDERGGGGFPAIDDPSIWRPGKVDFGPDNMMSRHTVHKLRELDVRTMDGSGNALPTIPPGEVVSVRLGNWNINAEGEKITYTVELDSIYRIILLKYAVVFQDPNHDFAEQPRFTMKITDERGNLVGDICGKEDFRPGTHLGADDGWHKVVTPLDGGGNDIVRWKEWTTVGVKVDEGYIGRKINITLQTYDCEQGGHYGYAYFTLSCLPATITGVLCGEQTEQTISAPDGFSYKWYLDDIDNPISTERTITVAEKDFRTYYCNCTFITTNEEKLDRCNFTLSANLAPRFPLARVITQHKPKNCKENYVLLNNVSTVIDGDSVPMGGERCDSYSWKLMDADGNPISSDSVHIPVDRNPMVLFPVDGGDYRLRLVASMSNGGCADSTDIELKIPALRDRFTWVDTTVCGKYPFRWNGNIYRMPGNGGDSWNTRDTVFYKTNGGCDSVIYLDLTMRSVIADTVTDTICQGEVYEFQGQYYSATGKYSFQIPPQTPQDCEETKVLDLTVVDTLSVTVRPLDDICADDVSFVLGYDVNQGEYISLMLDFDDASEKAGFRDTVWDAGDINADGIVISIPDGIRPDWYSLDLRYAVRYSDTRLDTLVRHVPFCILYPASVLRQKWNDAIAVLNAGNNGGYGDFVAFRWYHDGNLMPGQNRSYLYLGQGCRFGYGSPDNNYSAGLMRDGEDYYILTCAIEPVEHPAADDGYPVQGMARVSQAVRFEPLFSGSDIRIVARWWSIGGQLVAVQQLSSAEPVITAPYIPGVYMVELAYDTSGLTDDAPSRQLIRFYVK